MSGLWRCFPSLRNAGDGIGGRVDLVSLLVEQQEITKVADWKNCGR